MSELVEQIAKLETKANQLKDSVSYSLLSSLLLDKWSVLVNSIQLIAELACCNIWFKYSANT